MIIEFIEAKIPSRHEWMAVAGVAVVAVAMLIVGHVLNLRLDAVLQSRRSRDLAAEVSLQQARQAEPPPFASDADRAVRMALLTTRGALEQVELAATTGVRLKAIDFNATERTMNLQVEVVDDKALEAYLMQLNGRSGVSAYRVLRIVSLNKTGVSTFELDHSEAATLQADL